MLAMGGGGGFFPSYHTEIARFDQIFFKTSKFPNKKGTSFNLVFTATLACTKRALFITKKGTFGPLKKVGGGGTCPLCPPIPMPLNVGPEQLRPRPSIFIIF